MTIEQSAAVAELVSGACVGFRPEPTKCLLQKPESLRTVGHSVSDSAALQRVWGPSPHLHRSTSAQNDAPPLEQHGSLGSHRAALRLAALERDATQADTFDLARLWHELASGNWLFRDAFCTEKRAYAVLGQAPVSLARPVPSRTLGLLTRLLLGESQKGLSIDLVLAPSTVASRLHGALRAMGLPCSGSRAPVLLAMAAHAAHGRALVRGRHSQLLNASAGNAELYVVSVQRPDLTFPVLLSVAEEAVIRDLAAGYSHAEISEVRTSSPRTVANQLASAFRKLNVSGRGELVQCLIAHCQRASFAPQAALRLALPHAQGAFGPSPGLPTALVSNGFSQPEPAVSARSRAPRVARPAPSLTLPASA